MLLSATEKILDKLQRQSFDYFRQEYNPANGLVCDRSEKASSASIAAVGFGLTVYLVGVERGWISKAEALKRSLAAARFFCGSVQNNSAIATGRNGFFYHFLDMASGLRAGNCELSTIDSTLLFYGFLAAAEYFSGDAAGERELRERVQELCARADWNWARNGELTVTHGFRPRHGFIKHRWEGYSEALLLYVLGLGSSTYALPTASYSAWAKTYHWKKIYEREYLHAGPLFIHQFPQAWLDLRGVQDKFMRKQKLDYFENSRRATYIQNEYCVRNPRGFRAYSGHCWGLTASDGPGPASRKVEGKIRNFYGYRARGAPHGPDDGTISPWAVMTSLPFAPEIVLPTMEHFYHLKIGVIAKYGFEASFNPTFHDQAHKFWMSPCHFAINQGPMILMIENYRSGLIWKIMRHCQPIVTGLRRAGFTGSWLKP